MEIVIIILLLAVFVLLIVLTIKYHLTKSEKQKYYAAAGNILREEFLDYSLRNTASPGTQAAEPRSAKMMLYLKSKSSGKNVQFVFDPENEVTIGRDSGKCSIFINEPQVSQRHCRIYSYRDKVYLQDMGSANGTYVRRGFLKNYEILDGNQIELRTGDKISIASCVFDVRLFYYDWNTM